MRSVLENHVDDFLRILSHDKSEWEDFWGKLKKRFRPLLDEYERKVGDEFYSVLRSIRRMDLDRFRREWLRKKRELKVRAGALIRSKSEELDLKRADFVVFLFSGAGVVDHVIVKGKRESVIMVDIFKFWIDGNLERFPESVLEFAENFRKSGGERYGLQSQG